MAGRHAEEEEEEEVPAFGMARKSLEESNMDHLQDEMQRLLRSSSTNGRDAVRSSWLKSERCLRALSQLQSISARIDNLRRSNPGLDHGLKLMSTSSNHESDSAEEEQQFAAQRRVWELINGNKFEELRIAQLPGRAIPRPRAPPVDATNAPEIAHPASSGALTESKLILAEKQEIIDLEWPLVVYGIIAARDTVDSCRNPLFLCPRDEWQCITQKDPFLRLTGPARAILCEDSVSFEIQLKLKGRAESEDGAFISANLSHDADAGDRFSTLNVSNHFCKMELCVERFKHSVQATIMDVHVVRHGLSLPFPHGGQVVCSSLPRGIHEVFWPPSRQILLLDSVDERRFIDEHGYIDLQRNVVSAELQGELIVCIKVYSPCGDIDICGDVHFTPKKCNFSTKRIVFGDMEVEVTVAWSLLVDDDVSIQACGHVDPFGMCPALHPSLLKEVDWSVYA